MSQNRKVLLIALAGITVIAMGILFVVGGSASNRVPRAEPITTNVDMDTPTLSHDDTAGSTVNEASPSPQDTPAQVAGASTDDSTMLKKNASTSPDNANINSDSFSNKVKKFVGSLF
jgi:hypothetical protein